MKTSSIKKSKKLPKFITSHKIFTKFKTIEKVFPRFDLKNCSMRVSDLNYTNDSAKDIKAHLIKSFTALKHYYYDNARATRIVNLLKQCKSGEFIDKGAVVVPARLKNELTSFNSAYYQCRYGYGDYQYYERNRSCDVIAYLNLTPNAKVVFSSTGAKGLWDIATMSMRGISSCQSWDGSYKRNLVGSMIDPCVGIIYIQDGTPTSKGSRMKRRALVRYVINKTTHKPALLIERIYPSNENNNYGLNEPEAIAIFHQFLELKTKGKIAVVTTANNYSIPNSKIVQKMSSCGKFENGKDYCRSYRDSGIAYSKSTALFLKKIAA